MTQQEKIKAIANRCGIEVKLHPYEPAHSKGVIVTRSKETDYYPVVFNPFINMDQTIDCIERLAEKEKLPPEWFMHNKITGRMKFSENLRTALGEALYKYCDKN